MQINLKAHRVNRKQAAQIALLDAIIWLWLHQINYDSLFTVSFIDSDNVQSLAHFHSSIA